MAKIRNVINDLWQFIRNPEQARQSSHLPRFQTFVWLLLLDVSFAAIFTLPALYIIDQYILPLNYSPEFTEPAGLLVMIATMVLLGPFVEELLFRYPLKFARGRVLRVLVYLSSIIFGLVHFWNYANREMLFFLLVPVIFSSQLVGGFILAYIRIKQGLWWSILTHTTFNFIAVCAALLFMHNKVVLDESTDAYSLHVKEYVYLENGRKRFAIYRTGNDIDSISVRQVGLQTVLDSITQNQRHQVNNVIVDLDFKSVEPLAADSLIELLGTEYRIR